MPIQYVGGQTGGRAGATSTSSVNFALTGGIDTVPRDGDFVVITTVVASQARNPAQAVTGYTALDQLNPNATTQDTSLCVSYKHMLGTPATSFTLPSTGNNQDAQSWSVHVFRGVDLTVPLDVTPTSATGTGTSRADPPAITPTTAGAVILVCAGGSAATASEFTFSELTDVRSTASVDTNDAVVGSGYYTGWTSGAFNPAATTTGDTNAANSWAAYTLALRPTLAAADFSDNFNSTLDTNKWWNNSTAGEVASNISGELDLDINGSVNGDSAHVYSILTLNLLGSSVYVKLVRPMRTTSDAGGVVTLFMLEMDPGSGNGDRIYFEIQSSGSFQVRKQDNFVSSQIAEITANYFANASTHTWLRMRESGGTVFFDTAPSSASNPPASGDWVNRASAAISSLPANFSNANLNLYCLVEDGATSGVPTQSARFDGLNTAAGAGDVTGSLAASESGSDTASVSGAVKVAGSLAATESGADTFAGTGKTIDYGTLAATETGADAFAASGTVKVAGSLAATEGAVDTIAISGAVKVVGSLAVTEANDTFAASGVVKVAGALAATESGTDVFAANGVVGSGITGSLAATESGADVFAAAGVVKVAGSLAAVEPTRDTFAVSGAVKVVGSLAAIEAADSAAFAGVVKVAGALAATEGADVFAGGGQVAVNGTLSTSEAGADVFAGVGKVKVAGSLAAVEVGIDTLAIVASGTIAGSLAVSEVGADTFAGAGKVSVRGSLAATENSILIPVFTGIDTISISGKVLVQGTLAGIEVGNDTFASGLPPVFKQYPLRGILQQFPLKGSTPYPLTRS